MKKTIKKAFPVMEHMNVPNTITITGLVLGMLNIFFIVQGKYQLFYLCALLAGVMDSLDGFAAKRLNQYSELGEQLDCTALEPRLRICVPSILLVFGILMISRLKFKATNFGRVFFAIVGLAFMIVAMIIGK